MRVQSVRAPHCDDSGAPLTGPAPRHQPKADSGADRESALFPKAVRGDVARDVARNGVVQGATRLLTCRVDWLEVAYRVEIDVEVAVALEDAQDLADRGAGGAPFSVAGISLQVGRSRDSRVSRFANGDLHGSFERGAIGGWNLTLKLRAIYLATHELDDAVGLLRRTASGFGRTLSERLRRVDLAADYVGFPLGPNDFERLHTRARKRTTFLSDEKDGDAVASARVRQYSNAARDVTGLTIAPGSPLMCRIYDKTTELALPGQEAKREVEYQRWRRAGWRPGESVTRVEMQQRGDYITELGLRDPTSEEQLRVLEDLANKLDAIWQRAVCEWLRWIDPASAPSNRRDRAALDPRWGPVQRTVFKHQAEPIKLHRYRGGPSNAHAVGVLLANSAAAKRLTPMVVAQDSHTVPRNALSAALDESLSEVDAANCVRRELRAHCAQAAEAASDDYAQELVSRHGGRGALRLLAAKVNGLRARFSGVDDAAERGGT